MPRSCAILAQQAVMEIKWGNSGLRAADALPLQLLPAEDERAPDLWRSGPADVGAGSH